MQTFENQTVSRELCPIQLGPSERHNAIRSTQNVFLQDLEFVNCNFVGEGLTTYGAPIHRSTARNIQLKNCTVNSFFGLGAIFDEVVIDGLKTSAMPAILFGCALRHVVLTGTCGRFLLNRNICHDNEQRNDAFNNDNSAFYAEVDWALDISKLKPACLEIRGSIPSRLIRRNPEEHFIMTQSVAMAGDWKNYEPPQTFEISISTFLDSCADDTLFVAAKRSKHFKQEMEYFHRLKTAGLVT